MSNAHVVVLSGGIGGAKLTLGLYRVLPPGDLTVVVNTGDDLELMGLRICPDIDTTLYTLAGLSNRELGWGRSGETWSFKQVLGDLGGPTWFSLGDGDVALHVWRTEKLRRGEHLSAITQEAARRFGINANILPMSDQPVATRVATPEGELDFQTYFVRLRCEPRVSGLRFDGAEHARPAPGVLAALASDDLRAVIIAPSNPYLSIDPILAVPGLRQALRGCRAPVVAVTPILAGRSVKGPTDKIMAELGVPRRASSIAQHYRDLIDGFVLDVRDADSASSIPSAVHVCDTLMDSDDAKTRLGEQVLAFARRLQADGVRQ